MILRYQYKLAHNVMEMWGMLNFRWTASFFSCIMKVYSIVNKDVKEYKYIFLDTW